MSEVIEHRVLAKNRRVGPIELEPGKHHRIIIVRPEFHRVEFGCLRYREGSAVALPREANTWRHPLWAVIESIRQLQFSPKRELSIVGHAAPSEPDPEALSADRASGIHAIVTKKRDAWVAIAVRRGSLEDITSYFHYLFEFRGFSCECVTPSSESTPETQASVHAFQSDYNVKFGAKIDVDGVCGEQTLGAVFDTLRQDFEGWLVQEELSDLDVRLSNSASHFGVGARLFKADLMPKPAADDNRRVVDLIAHNPEDLDGDSPSAESLYVESLALIEETTPPLRHAYWAGAVRVWIDPGHDGDEPPSRVLMRLQGEGYQADLSLADATEDARHHLCLTFENVPILPSYDLLLDPHGDGTFHQPLLSDVGWQELRRGAREGVYEPGGGGDPIPPASADNAEEDDELELPPPEEWSHVGVEFGHELY